ncbi:MAG: Uma2 family endonuclease [Symploca sp. SIO1B1]|nr:Uma2 family endonuclease [Symploca sp. SIO1B1]
MIALVEKPQITWEKLPDDFPLPDDPVDNISQLYLAEGLTNSLETANLLAENALVASNYPVCATLDGKVVVKAPDWMYVPHLKVPLVEVNRSYTPQLQGDIPIIVMEFLSYTEGQEYSSKPTYPPGKWFYYEQVLKVPNYLIFEPEEGRLEAYQLDNTGRYQLRQPDGNNRYILEPWPLFLGVWQGTMRNRTGYWLRWWDESGNLLPWSLEQIEQERQRTEQERQRAEQVEKAQRESIPRLLDMGLSVEQVANALGIPVEEVENRE